MLTGRDAVREHQASLLASDWMDWQDKQFSKEKAWIKVNGDNAWAVCDNVWRRRPRLRRHRSSVIRRISLTSSAASW